MSETTKSAEKKRFNVIDALILALILAVVLGIVFRADLIHSIRLAHQEDSVSISFLATGLPRNMGTAFSEGEIFRIASDGTPLGTVSGTPTIVPAEQFTQDADGLLVRLESPDGISIDLRGIVLATGAYSGDIFLLNGTTPLAPGMTLQICSEKAEAEILITGIARQFSTSTDN